MPGKRFGRRLREQYPGRVRLDWPPMEERGDEVLGNLPRTRPGRRSEKRKGGAQRGAPRRRPAQQPPPQSDPDPLGGAVRAAAGAAEAGLRVANGLTRELLRRLPRP